MKKKLVLTLACLMSVNGACAWSWNPSSLWSSLWTPEHRSRLSSVLGSVKDGAVNAFNYIATPIESRLTSLLRTRDDFRWLMSVPSTASNFVQTYGPAAGISFAAGLKPNIVFPLLGGAVAAYKLKEYQDWHHPIPEAKNKQEAEGCYSQRSKRIMKQGLAGIAGAVYTSVLMKEPKLMTALSLLTGIAAAYKFGYNPFTRKGVSEEQETVQEGDVEDCPGGVCSPK